MPPDRMNPTVRDVHERVGMVKRDVPDPANATEFPAHEIRRDG